MPDENPFTPLDIDTAQTQSATVIAPISAGATIAICVTLLICQDQIRKSAVLTTIQQQIGYGIALCVAPYCLMRLVKRMES